MHSVAKKFFLAFFLLCVPTHAATHKQQESSPFAPNLCAIDTKATISDTCASYDTIDSLNDEIHPLLTSVTRDTDFFSYYRLNLFNKMCPFWQDENSMCGNIACAVNTIDSEEDLPPVWRVEELSKLEGPRVGHPGRQQQRERPRRRPLQGGLGEDVGESCVLEYDDECDERDYCIPEDEGALAKGDYVSLIDNPERFTGYAGLGAHQVWDSIYRENCFVKPSSSLSSQLSPLHGSQEQAANDFRNVLLHKEQPQPDDECIEKRVFHRIISGMHASISTHLCWEYFNQTTDEWGPNVQCYKDRLHNHPERISNLYFNYALVSRAVAKLQNHLQKYNFCSFDPDQDLDTKQKVLSLTNALQNRPPIFDEAVMFQDENAIDLKEDFRNRFRNVSRLMDCVGCDKCRLWGKIQVNGYGTALKVLFDYDETKDGENPPLRRTELVALINTYARISNSLAAVRSFRQAVESGHEDRLVIHPEVSSSPFPAKLRDSEKLVRYYKDGISNIYIEDDDDDYGYEDEHLPWKRQGNPESVVEIFWQEWNMFWGTYMWVLKSWLAVPRLLWQLFVFETNRLWNYWLGLPVPQRQWKIQLPRPPRDEL
ncbi:Endoplasmic reticulum oxidoreductin-1 [Talaromyces atroroseus]|uniref:Endoplasmic reticulum oxidoreductin-1 n=1 Tax=Talaromyces atroroseus TaxID=1441469 RepID=A0A225AQ70_TALAT|nr:Endoplasmic reticulum oxidoreductin-1 [Talaromyces atroroseus]OKL56575.1 Endoplasmic reticulum oxidoreductin-1 [Talaromyces atroroseus]